MARPIESTPTLQGEAAKTFISAVQNPKPYTPPVFNFDKMHADVQKIARERAKK